MFYAVVQLMFFHFRIQLKKQNVFHTLLLSNTEYSFLWKNYLWAQFCAVDVNRNCAINF